MGKKDLPLINNINQKFIALTVTAIWHCLLPWQTGKFRVPPGYGPGGRAQCKYDTGNNNQLVSNACTDVFCHLDMDFRSASPDVQAK